MEACPGRSARSIRRLSARLTAGRACTNFCFQTEITCSVAGQTQLQCRQHWVYCSPNPCGRLPAGLRDCTVAGQPSLIAAALTAAARLEGAAVFAFRAVEKELIAHGAPAALVARARSAQRDEQRHHAAMSGLAARFGAQVPAVEVAPVEVRTLLEVALENAVEGCVRETWGAAVAAARARMEAARRRRRSWWRRRVNPSRWSCAPGWGCPAPPLRRR